MGEENTRNDLDDDLLRVSEDYFSGKHPLKMKSLLNILRKAYSMDSLVNLYEETIGRKFMPMPLHYQTNVIKYILTKLEKISEENGFNHQIQDTNMDISEIPGIDLWYDELQELSLCQVRPDELFFRYYNFSKDSPIIKIYEDENKFVSDGTTGLKTWEASLQCSKWMESSQWFNNLLKNGFNNFNPTWSVELGSGTGLLGITALKLFSKLKCYYFTDGSEAAIANCKRNFHKNFSDKETSRAEFAQLDWKDVEKYKDIILFGSQNFGNGGILFAADIVFDPCLIPSILKLIKIALENGLICILSSTVRNAATHRILLNEFENETEIVIQEAHQWKTDSEESGNISLITSSSAHRITIDSVFT